VIVSPAIIVPAIFRRYYHHKLIQKKKLKKYPNRTEEANNEKKSEEKLAEVIKEIESFAATHARTNELNNNDRTTNGTIRRRRSILFRAYSSDDETVYVFFLNISRTKHKQTKNSPPTKNK